MNKMDYTTIVKQVNKIFTQYEFALTLRQIYYRLLPSIPNTKNSYNYLSKILVKARENGDVDERKIEDRTRSTIGGDDGYNSLQEFVDAMIDDFVNSPEKYFQRKMWKDQDNYVEIWVEKDALSIVISNIAQGLKVTTCPSRGYGSYSYLRSATRRILRYIGDGKKVTILHFTDHDPSGIDMTRDLGKRMLKYLCMEAGDEFDEKEYDVDPENYMRDRFNFEVQRIALTYEMVKKYNLSPNPTKMADPRSPLYVAQFGNKCWELDALEPKILEDLVKRSISHYIDIPKWDKMLETEKKETTNLKKKFSKITDAINKLFK